VTRTRSSDLVVGFDLDMTLIDSRPGIASTLELLARETGTPIDVALVVNRLGPKLETELGQWFPPAEVAAAADRYRELYKDHGVPGISLLPGAHDSVAAVRELGGRSIVVTAKYEPNAVACLAHVGLGVEAVIGWRHGPDKGETLAAHGADVYVGDTPSDVVGARAASAYAIAVASGPHRPAELEEAGADLVMRSLVEFPAWIRSWAVSAR
jgi:phosphoglycolate phosphatase